MAKFQNLILSNGMQTQTKPNYYSTLWELYKDQNDAFKARLRQFWADLGYKGGSINRKLKEGDETRTIKDLHLLNVAFDICYDPKRGYFFDQIVANNDIYMG